MKICKRIIGGVTLAAALVAAVLYFVTKGNPSSALAVATYYPADTTKVDYTVYIALWITLACTAAAGTLSILFADSRKMEVLMIIFYAVGLLLGLLFSLLTPITLWIAVMDFVALMFSVSYSQLENDFNGKL